MDAKHRLACKKHTANGNPIHFGNPNRRKTLFKHLRTTWRQMILDQRLDRKLLAYVAQGPCPELPFSDETLQPFMQVLHEFILSHGISPDWSVREHQPMRLGILSALSTTMSDKDTTLFEALPTGVSTGFNHDIPPSNCFPTNDRQPDTSTILSAHLCNLASAEADIELTRTLVEEEVSKGWVTKFPGDLSDAQDAYPSGVAVGELGVATSDSRPPRLVVDQSVCRLNQRCHKNQSGLPCLQPKTFSAVTLFEVRRKILWLCLLTSNQLTNAWYYMKKNEVSLAFHSMEHYIFTM